MFKLIKYFVFFIIIFDIPQISFAKFEKEVELIDQGYCEEALLENDRTAEEEKKTWYLKKPFRNKYSLEIFEAYRINRRVTILDLNCKRKEEALALALKALEIEKRNAKFPFKKIKKLKITKFQRLKSIADANSRIASLYNSLGKLELAIKYEKKSIELYESTDLYHKESLLEYAYGILAAYYNGYGDLKSANLYRKKHITYMKSRFGDGTQKYFKSMFDAHAQYLNQGYYNPALNLILEIKKDINIKDYYKNDLYGNLKFHHDLATTYYLNGNFKDAIPIHRRNLKELETIKPKESNKIKLIKWETLILNDLALTLQNLYPQTANIEFLDEAEKIYLKISEITKTTSEKKIQDDWIITENNLAGIYLLKGELKKARDTQKKTYELCVKLYDEKDLSCLKQMASLGVAEMRFNLENAKNILEKFITLEPKNNRAFLRTRVNVRGSLGVIYSELGNEKKAEELALEAVNLVDPTDSRFRESYIFSMNDYYLAMIKGGKKKEAIEGYKELISLAKKYYGETNLISITLLNNLAYSYGLEGQGDKALDIYLKGENLATRFLGEKRTLANIQMNIADLYFYKTKLHKSKEYSLKALKNKDVMLPKGKILLYSRLSSNESLLGNHKEALHYAKEGMKIAENYHGTLHPSNLTLLDALTLANKNNKNFENYFQNLTDIYTIINDYSNGHTGKNFSASHSQEYFPQIWSFLYAAAEKNDGEDIKFKNYFNKVSTDTFDNAIFNMTETLRTTKVSIDTNKMLARNFFKNEKEIKKLKLLDKKLEEYDKIPKYSKNQEEKKKLTIKITSYKREIEQLKKELNLGKYLKGDSFIYNDINVEDVKKSLNDNEVILFYLAYPNDLYLGLISNKKLKLIHKKYKNSEIYKLTQKLRANLKYENNKLNKFDLNISNQLYKELIRPFKNELVKKERLIIIPNGTLLSVPFELFTDPLGKAKNLSKANWLIKNFDITYYPSISSYYLMQESKKRDFNNYFAGFGNPKLAPENKKINVSELKINDLFLRGGIADVKKIKQLGELPKTAEEIQKISKFFKQKDIFLGEKFNEKIIKTSNLSKYSVISFATHGIIADEIKGLKEPGLIATPPQKGTIENDGVLTASEIKKLNFDSELIILSACNTAAPDGTSSADGLSGIASSFFYAGARSLLVSHWYVEDESTVNLMTGMFDNLPNAKNITSALRKTKLKMIQDKKTEHPIFWAPFVLIGGSN